MTFGRLRRTIQFQPDPGPAREVAQGLFVVAGKLVEKQDYFSSSNLYVPDDWTADEATPPSPPVGDSTNGDDPHGA